VVASLPPLPAETGHQIDTPPSVVHFPPLDLLERMVAATPGETRLVLMFMPLWLGAQATPGTLKAATTAACKQRVEEIARARPGTVVMDFLRASAITREPTNYWDPLHFRDAVAVQIMRHLGGVAVGVAVGGEDYALLAP
jgi:hypothetical protein